MMELLTIEEARSQCRVVGTHDDADLISYVRAAGAAASAYLNRPLFNDQAALEAALEAAPGKIAAAIDAYAQAVKSAHEAESPALRDALISVAESRMAAAELEFRRTLRGMVAVPDILDAVRLMLYDMYDARDSSVAPMSDAAKSLLRPHRWTMMP